MSRGINEIQLVGFPIPGLVIERHALGLDGDAPLTLELHGIQYLLFQLALGQPPQTWIKRSARVDLPWSMWAMMEKLRIFLMSVIGPVAQKSVAVKTARSGARF